MALHKTQQPVENDTPTSVHTSDQGKPAIFVIFNEEATIYYWSKVNKQEQKRGQQRE